MRKLLDVRGTEPGALLVGCRRGGQIARGPLTGSGVWQIVSAVTKDAGIGHYSPHTLRHAAATHAVRAGASLIELRALGGWAPSSSVPLRYLDAEGHDRLSAMQRISLGK